jgi:hypothetical protein
MSNQFERLKSHKNYWHNKAADLFRGACKINENDSDGFLDSVTRMLMGMSFEALFKGLTVAQGLEYKKTHDLLKLANDACVEVSDEEQKILSILTQYTIWDGRYPTPKDPNALEIH